MELVSTKTIAIGTDYELVEQIYEGFPYKNIDYAPMLTRIEVLNNPSTVPKFRIFIGCSYYGHPAMTDECDANGVLNMTSNMSSAPHLFRDVVADDPVLAATGVLDRVMNVALMDATLMFKNPMFVPKMRFTYVNLWNRKTAHMMVL
uniref:Uncharacterized protein n=1 Tax=viral metagenome TaxID=1070528 RepID=A0A6C0LXG0_9ZZZZ